MMDEVPKCTQLIIVGTFSDGKTKTLVFPEPEKVSMDWSEEVPEIETVLTPSQAKIFKPSWEFGLRVKPGQRGVIEIRAPEE
jgi:hypothetical protein